MLKFKFTFQQIILAFFLHGAIYTANGQALEREWSEILGDDYYDEITAVVESKNGDIAICGNIELGKNNQPKDIFFALIRTTKKQRTIIVQKHYGGTAEDGANAMIQTLDGGFAIAGFVSNKKGKQAYLLKLDHHGNKLTDTIIQIDNIIKTGELKDLIQLADGTIIAVGDYGSKICLARFDWTGQLQQVRKTTRSGTAHSLCANTEKNELLVCGKRGAGGFGLKINKDLEEQKFISFTKLSTANDVIYDSGNLHYYILGAGKKLDDEGNAKELILLSFQSKTKVIYELNSKTSITGTRLRQFPTGEVLLAGYSKDSFSGFTNNDISPFVICLNKPQKKEVAFGNQEQLRKNDMLTHEISLGKFDDKLLNMNLTTDGSVLIAGTAQSVTRGRKTDGFLSKLVHKQKQISEENSDSLQLEIVEVNLIDGNKDNIIDHDERGYFSMLIKNNSMLPSGLLKLGAVALPRISGFEILDNTLIRSIPGQSLKEVFIPVRGQPQLHSGSTAIHFRLSNKQGVVVTDSIYNSLATKAAPLPILHFSNHQFSTGSRLPDRSEQIILAVTLKNKGEGIANNIITNFNLPYMVEPQEEDILETTIINPGDSVSLSFTFKASPFYFKDFVNINCVAYERNAKAFANASYFLNIRNFFEEKISDGKYIRPKGIDKWIKTHRGPCPSENIPIMSTTDSITWWFQEEEQDILKEGLDWHINYMIIKAKIHTQKKIKDKDQITISNAKTNDYDELMKNNAELKELEHSENGYLYMYYNKILLKKGNNLLKIKFEDMESEKFKIFYIPPDYHIYSIGVAYDSTNTFLERLNYTRNDAEHIAEQLGKQNSSDLYGKVKNNQILCTPEQTSINDLESLFGGFGRNAYADSKKIKNHEVIFLYLSGHGSITKDSSYYILPSGMKSNNSIKRLALNFRDDIVMNLTIPNPQKVYIFVDACHSGQAIDIVIKKMEEKGAFVKPALEKIDAFLMLDSLDYKHHAIQMFASCTAHQESVEIEELEHGIFTFALLHALSNQALKIKRKTFLPSADPFVSMEEIDQFLSKVVPLLCKDYKLKGKMTPLSFIDESDPFLISK